MSNYVDMMKRASRNHPGLNWESRNVHSYGFSDVNQIALDNRYGKVGAPLSKRKNGSGPAGRNAPPGLFGTNNFTIEDLFTIKNVVIGALIASAVVYYYK